MGSGKRWCTGLSGRRRKERGAYERGEVWRRSILDGVRGAAEKKTLTLDYTPGCSV
jgi:hypothetical protein